MTCCTARRRDVGLLLLRLGTGGVLAAHGAQKLFGWFGGHGIEATGQYMESVGYAPGKASATAAGLAETGGGALLALGLATPAAGAAAAGAMVGAAAVHAPNGFFAQSGGYEYAAFLALAATGLAVTGPGRLSLDHALGHVTNRAWMVPAALGMTAAATSVVVGLRYCRVRDLGARDDVQEALFEE
ncbi:DoxX family protein [Streptomyces acidiscabies]|uniref:DoxX family protein n=4 Tax=Streptomyces acidiscabies TaxID=42234 RepID=A0AAP6EDJ3_9ACTN|nr:DoxX family protein [Streptomyces acidiscabies]MBZ3911206.1 DoxX family protein [Streptomyces acidiscabies]MDX2959012.1 DoxX family protein [Streptomyces acidiscabies]MDX3023860.1 DoxX family protein [Streptomyces acidiscabies]MDX3788319.1 DoxX family protein [Streptomyces acidiscabies]